MFLDGIGKFFKSNGRDYTVFLLSLLLAFSVWLVYNLTFNYTKVVSVPVVAYCNLEGHKQLSSNSALVMGRCRATGFDLLRIERTNDRNPVTVSFNPSDLHNKEGETFYITSGELNSYVKDIFGDKAGMESFVTDTLFFRFPFENSKKVPVYPVYSFSCRPQYMTVGGIKMTPDSVTVYGEPHYLDNIDRVYTRPLALMNLKSSAHGDVKLVSVKGVRLSDESAGYVLDVSRYVEVTANVEIRGRNVPANKSMVIYPSVAKVRFMCAFPLTADPQQEMQFYVDYNDFQQSLSGECIARSSQIPEGVYSYKMEPEVFECFESER